MYMLPKVNEAEQKLMRPSNKYQKQIQVKLNITRLITQLAGSRQVGLYLFGRGVKLSTSSSACGLNGT